MDGEKYGFFHPQLNVFYTVPVKSKEELREFMMALGLTPMEESPKQSVP